jgi:serine/threonine-protein kinase
MILEGSVRKSQASAHCDAAHQAATDSHLWSETYDRTLEDIFAVQDDIAQSVVKELAKRYWERAPDDPRRCAQVKADVVAAAKGRSKNAEAHELYLQAQFLVERHTPEDTAKEYRVLPECTQARFAVRAGLAGLAGRLLQPGRVWLGATRRDLRARQGGARARWIWADSGRGHAELGWIRMTYDWDWRAADASYARALELAPGIAPL